MYEKEVGKGQKKGRPYVSIPPLCLKNKFLVVFYFCLYLKMPVQIYSVKKVDWKPWFFFSPLLSKGGREYKF